MSEEAPVTREYPPQPESEASGRRSMSTGRWIVALIAAVLFAYDLFEGLSNLLGTAGSALAPFLPASVWTVIVGSVIAPIITYIAAFLIARRVSAGGAALVFLVGLCVSAALSLTLGQLFVLLVVGSS